MKKRSAPTLVCVKYESVFIGFCLNSVISPSFSLKSLLATVYISIFMPSSKGTVSAS